MEQMARQVQVKAAAAEMTDGPAREIGDRDREVSARSKGCHRPVEDRVGIVQVFEDGAEIDDVEAGRAYRGMRQGAMMDSQSKRLTRVSHRVFAEVEAGDVPTAEAHPVSETTGTAADIEELALAMMGQGGQGVAR
jgi:hypothetical protein